MKFAPTEQYNYQLKVGVANNKVGVAYLQYLHL